MKSKKRSTTSAPTHRDGSPRFASAEAADALLADILDETEEEARRQEAELERSIAAQREAEAAAEAARKAALLAERNRKLEVELERQRELAQRRTHKMNALRAEESPEITSEDPAPAMEERAAHRDETREAPVQRVEPHLAPAESLATGSPARRASISNTALAVVALAAAVLVATSAGFVAFATGGHATDPNAYAKSVFAPADRQVVAMEVGFVPLPVSSPPTAVVEKTAPSTTKSPARRPASKPDARSLRDRPAPNAPRKSLGKFEGLDAADPFAL